MKSFLALFSFLILTALSPAKAQQGNGLATNKYVKIENNFGVMIFKLYNETPKHEANFIKLVKKGYFNGYDFNRIIKGFVIQGGETDSVYAAIEKAGQVVQRLPAEFISLLFHQKGALAAGRDDNKEKASFLGQIYVVDGKKYTD